MKDYIFVIVAALGISFTMTAEGLPAQDPCEIEVSEADEKGAKVIFNHCKTNAPRSYSITASHGKEIKILITATRPSEFTYNVAGVLAATPQSQGPSSREALTKLENKVLTQVHDEKYGGYIVYIRLKPGGSRRVNGTKQLEDVTLIINVESAGFVLEPAGGFTISDIKDPVFAVRTTPVMDMSGMPTGESESVVIRDQDAEDSAKLGVAAFLHVYNKKYPKFAASFGLGINEGSQATYYLGPTYRLGKQVGLTAGWSWSSVRRLPAGTMLNAPISDPSNVLNNLGSRVDHGFFFAVSYSFLGQGLGAFEKPFKKPEESGGQNSQEAAPREESKPDLALDQIGDSYFGLTNDHYYLRIKNEGSANAPESETKLTVRSEEGVETTLRVDTRALEAGKALDLTLPKPFSSLVGDDCKAVIELDSGNEIDELNEANNKKEEVTCAPLSSPSESRRPEAPAPQAFSTDRRPALPFPPGIRVQSQCGLVNDLQDVELYDGTLGVTRAYVDEHQPSTVQLQWVSEDAIGTRLPNYSPGNVPSFRWCSGTLISDRHVLTAGHCFDQQKGENGWTTPYTLDSAGLVRYASPSVLATLQVANFLYQIDGSRRGLRAAEAFPVVRLVEYREGQLDYAIVELGANRAGELPGKQFGPAAWLNRQPSASETIAVIQHPQGQPKKVEAGRILGVFDAGLFYNDVDTFGGSSGSGVRDGNGAVIGVHTHGGCEVKGDPMAANKGVPLFMIASVSQFLSDSGR